MNSLRKMDGTAVPQMKSVKIKSWKGWLAPALLLALGLLNVLSGALQLGTIQQGPPAVPDQCTSMHYFAMPIPIVLHIVSGIILNLLGPMQFAPVFLQRWPRWHRWSGRLLIVAGFFTGLTGLWMNQFYPAYGGALKYSGIVVNSVGLMVAMGIALQAIRIRNFKQHKIWMMRAIAFGLGPATQRLFFLPIFFITGSVNESLIGFVIWFGFGLNLIVVEWVLRRNRKRKLEHPGKEQSSTVLKESWRNS